ncbi:9842_t:CDS:2, partial [Racocetra fulgida]
SRRPKAAKSHTAPPVASGRVTKRNSVSNATKTGKDESSTRGAGRGGRGGRGGSTRGRKPSLQRQQSSGALMLEHLEGTGAHSTTTNPTSNINPSTLRDFTPQTPGEEIDQYIRRDEEITDTDFEKSNKDVKPWGSEGPLSPDHIREAFRRYKQETGFTTRVSQPVFLNITLLHTTKKKGCQKKKVEKNNSQKKTA